MGFNWKSVESTNIKRVGFDAQKKMLRIEYHNGGTYQYHPFTVKEYNDLMEAKSVGKYVWANIRDNTKYQWEKVN